MKKFRHGEYVTNQLWAETSIEELGYCHLTPILAPKTSQILELQFWCILMFFFCQIVGGILSKLNSETIFVILSSRGTFKNPNMKAGLKLHFLASLSILKVLSLVHKSKKQFL